MQIADADTYLKALLSAPRPGADRFLAFYDHRTGLICKDPRLLLLPLDDHICHRGDGLFESICYREGKVFVLDAHLARMREGAAALDLEPPCPFGRIREIILAVARASGASHGDLRVFLSRGPGGFGISPAECPVAGLYVVALSSRLPDDAIYLKGLTAFTSAIPPKQEYLAKIKNTNYLPNVFMAAEARGKGMDVAVSFDEQGIMCEAAVANIGIIDQKGTLRFPGRDRILAGTTMLRAMELGKGLMPVQEGPISHAEIMEAREVMLFTSATLCVGITHFDGKPVGQGDQAGKPGPVALRLKDILLADMLAQGVAF